MWVRNLVSILALMLAARPLPLAFPQPELAFPKQVIEQYWNYEVNGGRLTDEGWVRAGKYYYRPSAPPKLRTIVVIHPDYSVWSGFVHGNSARVIIGLREIGEIDYHLQFTPHKSNSVKEGHSYALRLTDTHWQLLPGSKTLSRVPGPSEWRIDGADNKIWLTLDIAVKYVFEIQTTTSDPSVKKKADRTLAMLKRYSHNGGS